MRPPNPIKIDVPILQLNEPSVNNRLYLPENITLKKEGYIVFSEDGFGSTIDISKIAGGFNKVRIVDNMVVCDITFLDTPCGRILKSLDEFSAPLKYYASGLGELETREDGVHVVKEYKMNYVSVGKAE